MRPHRDGERVKTVYGETGSLRAAGAVLQCSATTVGRQLASIGIARRPARGKRRPSFTPAQSREIVTGYRDNGASLAALAAQFECSQGKIRRLLEFEGVPIRVRGRPGSATPPPPAAADVLRLQGQGLRPADIAAELKCDKDDVLCVLHAEEQPPNRGKPLPPAAELLAAHAAAGSIRAVARRYRVSEQRVSAALTAAAAAQAQGTADSRLSPGRAAGADRPRPAAGVGRGQAA